MELEEDEGGQGLESVGLVFRKTRRGLEERGRQKGGRGSGGAGGTGLQPVVDVFYKEF